LENYPNVYTLTGTNHFIGPSAVYSAACSSSLIALHSAVRSLKANDCEMAIVLGVNAMLSCHGHLSLAIAGMISESGRCHTFDSSADGFVRGKGCCAIVLKRYSNITSGKHPIHAMIKGIQVAQSGKTASLTALMVLHTKILWQKTLLLDAGLVGTDVNYMEMHGKASLLGDSIEMGAIAKILCSDRSGSKPLVVSAVKANIGHSGAASSLASLIKAVMILQHGQAPSKFAFEDIESEHC
jgi:acyl transferase domain-containing protein